MNTNTQVLFQNYSANKQAHPMKNCFLMLLFMLRLILLNQLFFIIDAGLPSGHVKVIEEAIAEMNDIIKTCGNAENGWKPRTTEDHYIRFFVDNG